MLAEMSWKMTCNWETSGMSLNKDTNKRKWHSKLKYLNLKRNQYNLI